MLCRYSGLIDEGVPAISSRGIVCLELRQRLLRVERIMSQLPGPTNYLRNCGTSVVLGLTVAVGLTALGSSALAQAPPYPTSVPSVPPTVPAAPTGFIGKCTSCISSIGGCFKGCCNKPLGRLINGAIKPLEMATGGVIPAPCPDPDEPSKHGDGAGGSSQGGPPGPQQAAQAIKKDQAQAKARCQAVQYLATVPCHYYPEAEAALIQALRTDRSECVRWEAAHALAQGCCCTKKTIEALKIVVAGSQKDGNPSEKSFRVQVEALNALERCLTMCGTSAEPNRPEFPAPAPQSEAIPTPLPQPKRPELPLGQDGPTAAPSSVQQVNYYEEIEKQSTESLLVEARRLVEVSKRTAPAASRPRRGNSLSELWRRSDRSEDVAKGDAEESASPVPTLAPTTSPQSPVDLVSRQPMAPVASAVQSYVSTPMEQQHPWPIQIQSQFQLPPAYPYSNMPPSPDAAAGSQPLPSLSSTPPSYGQWPSASLPPIGATESPARSRSEVQALPPLWTLPGTTMPPGETVLSAPGEISAAVGLRGPLYPSTNVPARVHGPTAHVARQPEWVNPQPRR